MSRTVDKALGLLRLVASSDSPVGLMEIAAMAKVDKSTALRLLTSLSKQGFVSRDAQRRYHLGPELLRIASHCTVRRDLRQLALPHLRRLATTARETASLHLLIGDARVCVDGVDGPEPIRRATPLGEVQPLHEGPTGKVILAFLPSASQEKYLSATDLAPATLKQLRRQLEQIRERGYLAAIGDRVAGASGLSAPILEHEEVCASITLAGPKERWTMARMIAFAPELLVATADISNNLDDKQIGKSPPPRSQSTGGGRGSMKRSHGCAEIAASNGRTTNGKSRE